MKIIDKWARLINALMNMRAAIFGNRADCASFFNDILDDSDVINGETRKF